MPMSKEHKEALAKGRRESRAVKRYLEALQSRKRGRPANPERLKERMEKVEKQLQSETDPLKRLELQQDRIDAEDAYKAANKTAQIDDLEKEFRKVVKSYSERKGITYTAWREEGVPAEVLRKAGVPRTRRS